MTLNHRYLLPLLAESLVVCVPASFLAVKPVRYLSMSGSAVWSNLTMIVQKSLLCPIPPSCYDEA
jgi:hypothetical protein